jgi:hypothetical protein
VAPIREIARADAVHTHLGTRPGDPDSLTLRAVAAAHLRWLTL